MVKSCGRIRNAQRKVAQPRRAVSACRIAPERLEWRRRSSPTLDLGLEQDIEADFDQALPISSRELDAVRRLLGDDLDLFLRSLSGH
jgi:hypothetical protein